MTVKCLSAPILVTGSRGMLGRELVEAFCTRWGAKSVIGLDSSGLDITQPLKVLECFKNQPISFLVNCAAYTDVDKAETERERALAVNAVGPKVLSNVASSFGVPIIHFSTDYVFSGSKVEPLTEEDIPSPPKPNYYGETKLLGERAVLEQSSNIVLRVQWLYGKSKERFSHLKDRSEFYPFDDQWGAPTWCRDVSQVVCDLIEKKAKGLFHFAYDDFATWYDVYQFVCNEMGYSTQLIPKKIAELNLPAKRPRYGMMSNKKLLRELGRESMGSWKIALREFLRTL